MEGAHAVEVAIELVKQRKFKWMGGMKTACGVRIKEGWQIDKWLASFGLDDSPVPDINDPGTKGCLLYLVRSISEDSEAYACRYQEGWAIHEWPEPSHTKYYPTEGGALSQYIIEKGRY